MRAFARHLDRNGHAGPIPLESTLDWPPAPLERPTRSGPVAGHGAGPPASLVRTGRCHRGARSGPARPAGGRTRTTCTKTARSPTCWPPGPSRLLPAACGRCVMPPCSGSWPAPRCGSARRWPCRAPTSTWPAACSSSASASETGPGWSRRTPASWRRRATTPRAGAPLRSARR